MLVTTKMLEAVSTQMAGFLRKREIMGRGQNRTAGGSLKAHHWLLRKNTSFSGPPETPEAASTRETGFYRKIIMFRGPKNAGGSHNPHN